MRKFLLALSVFLLFVCVTPIFAQTESETGNIVIEFSRPNVEKVENALVVVFNKNKVLMWCKLYPVETKQSGICEIKADICTADGDIVKVVFPKENLIITDVALKKVLSSPTTTATSASESTPSPTLNPVYPREVDAVEAFAVVDKVSRVMIEDELVTKISCFYQGREAALVLEDGTTISTAPDAASDLAGSDATNLQKGDVIVFSTSLSGKIKSVNLIYRPEVKNIITSNKDFGENFEKLFSSNGVIAGNSGWAVLSYGKSSNAHTAYAFGVIQSKNDQSFTLFNKGGKESDSLDLSFEKGTVVYICDMTDGKELEISKASSIQRSAISKASYDDYGNITSWDEDGSYVYALARVIDGTVSDVVIYLY
ncbi:MAG: hypothetical protein N2171_02600 [Clostridia bacterium]|nr:hypothetical protein [Clostridia bacterium]